MNYYERRNELNNQERRNSPMYAYNNVQARTNYREEEVRQLTRNTRRRVNSPQQVTNVTEGPANIRFSFGSNYNETSKRIAADLEEKINDLLAKLDLNSEDFFDGIIPGVTGFYISSPNMNREIKENKNNGSRKIKNIFFRLRLDDQAKSYLDGHTVMLKGDLVLQARAQHSFVEVRDFYLELDSEKLEYEYLLQGKIDYRNRGKKDFGGNNIGLSLDLLRKIPYIVEESKHNKFINEWREFLELENSISQRNIKSHPISDNIKYNSVSMVESNAVNKEKYKDYILAEQIDNHLYIDSDCPHLSGEEQNFVLVSLNVAGKEFGADPKKAARNFARFDLSIIDKRQNENLGKLKEDLKSRKNNLLEISGVEFDAWLSPEYNKEKNIITFRFLLEDDKADSNAKRARGKIEKLDKELFLAHIPTGDIALYRRGKETLDKLESGDVKNPYIVAFMIEPEKFEKSSEIYNMDNVDFALKELNPSQKEAVVKCLNSNSLFLLQGPPGTGKTQTITELVYQYNKMGKKVLLSSQTHIAIDNVIERLPKELNILPIRLVKDRNKANKQYLPDKILDNLYDAAHDKIQDKINAFQQYKQNLEENTRIFEDNKAIHKKIKDRLELVKNREEELHNINKEISKSNSEEHDKNYLAKDIEASLRLFDKYKDLNLTYEKIIDNDSHQELLDALNKLAKKYGKPIEEDLYNLSITFKKIAGQKRIKDLENFQTGGDKPKDLIEIEKLINSLQDKTKTFTEYGQDIPKDLRSEINKAMQKKKSLDIKYESSEYKVLDLNKIDFYFGQNVIDRELEAIKKFNSEYEAILAKVFSRKKYEDLKNKKDALNTEIQDIENKTKRLEVQKANIEKDIARQQKPISDDRKKLDEYFASFYTDKLNGASMPETEEEKFNNVKQYIDEEKAKFATEEKHFKKLSPIYSNIVKNLSKRDNSIEWQRTEFTKDLLKNNANVYGITCTSSPRFKPDNIVGKTNNDKNSNPITAEDIDISRIDFDVVVIDEVSKATPIEMLIPIVYGKSVVLVGDQRQLPPIFKYRENMFKDLSEEKKHSMFNGKELNDYKAMVENSLFEEIYNKIQTNRAMLTNQYRFNEKIMNCVNVFYDGKLALGLGQEQNNKKQHYLDASIPGIKGREINLFCRNNSTYWFNSHRWADGEIAYASVMQGETSLQNKLEAKITVELLLLLEKGYGDLKQKNSEEYKLSAGDGEKPSVAVISMYGKQIRLIRDELKARKMNIKEFKNISLDISTVDNYQGKEQDIVLVNMVANNKHNKLSEFLQSFNRLNVAISRARTMLIMVGSQDFFSDKAINVPKMETGEENMINAYHKIYENCDSKWSRAADLFNIKKEGV